MTSGATERLIIVTVIIDIRLNMYDKGFILLEILFSGQAVDVDFV